MQSSKETIDQLMRQHGTRLLRLCALLLQDADLAQDAVQDTFLRAWRRFDAFRGDANALTWLTAIAVNVCRDYQRGSWFRRIDRRQEPSMLPEPSADFPFPDSTVITEVMRLAPKYREVVLLRYYQRMKLKDVALALHLSERSVRQRLSKANGILRERLREWYENEGS